MAIASWQKAMALLFTEKVAPMDNDLVSWDLKAWLDMPESLRRDYYCVRTVNQRIPLFSIGHLTGWSRLPDRFVKYSRQSVLQRDGMTCAYCGGKFRQADLSIDHIVPRAQGGKNTWDNVITACKSCNHRKADRTPAQAKMELLFKPRKPSWLSMLGKKTSVGNIPDSWKKFIGYVEGSTQTET